MTKHYAVSVWKDIYPNHIHCVLYTTSDAGVVGRRINEAEAEKYINYILQHGGTERHGKDANNSKTSHHYYRLSKFWDF